MFWGDILMRSHLTRIAVFCFLVLSLSSFALAQGGAGQVGGIVQDTSKALIPGATITLLNTDTGIVTTQLTNESGAYSFLSVPPGTYMVSGSLPGFKTSVTNNVQVGLAKYPVYATFGGTFVISK
jgi:hypothetical protein